MRPDSRSVYGIRFVQQEEGTGRHYVDRPVRQPDGSVKIRRRYGVVIKCIECGEQFLQIRKAALGYCSRSCAKKGNPSERKVQSKTAKKLLCDKLFSMAVRDRGACERCGATRYLDLQCAHVISRRYLGTRWDPINAFCLCKGCHFWGGANPLEWEDFCIEKLGEETYLDIKRRARAKATPDYVRILEQMETLVESTSGLPRPRAMIDYTYRQRNRINQEL